MVTAVVTLENISKDYTSVKALSDINLSIKQGGIHGLLGPNGAGKSTLMSILAGILLPTTGEIIWHHKERPLLGLLPEHSPLYPQMRVVDYLHYVSILKKLPIKYVHQVIEQCSLGDVQQRMIANLSRGYRQRVNLAQALLGYPKFIILDEPFIGLDPNSIQEIRELIVSLKNDATILFSSHQLHEVEMICDEVTILHRGLVLSSGTLEHLQKSVKNESLVYIDLLPSEQDWRSLLTDEFSGLDIHIEREGHRTKLEIVFTHNLEHIVEQVAKIVACLVTNGGQVVRVEQERRSLEELFDKIITAREERC